MLKNLSKALSALQATCYKKRLKTLPFLKMKTLYKPKIYLHTSRNQGQFISIYIVMINETYNFLSDRESTGFSQMRQQESEQLECTGLESSKNFHKLTFYIAIKTSFLLMRFLQISKLFSLFSLLPENLKQNISDPPPQSKKQPLNSCFK